MKECIDREEVIRICERLRDKTDNDDMAFALNWAIQSIKGIPAEDVPPVVRGKWKVYYTDLDNLYTRCTACLCNFKGSKKHYNFCPNCGADMMEINDETA